MALPSERAIYDKFQLSVNGRPLKVVDFSQERIVVPFDLAPHEPATIVISYHSQGVDTWHYLFGDGINRVENFTLTMTTNFTDIDFPENTLAPTDKSRQGEGWKIHWRYDSLLTGLRLGMDLPNKLNPGPLASSISFFAPVSLLFYFGALFMLSLIRGVRLHPMHYLFLAATFFSFHLLFAYTVDHLPLTVAFILSSAVSLTLAFTYLRLVTGRRFALVEAGLSQLIFLILFSLAHFFAGYTGLTVTIGAIITLAVLMQMTARIDWEQKFRGTC
jgi:inner membrane protein involved in colicin E2 resistance